MARAKAFGVEGFGSLVTRTPAYNLEAGQLSVATNVDRSVSGALTVPHDDLTTVTTAGSSGTLGGAMLRYGTVPTTHAVSADNAHVYQDGTSIGDAETNATYNSYRFLTEGDLVYAFNGKKNQVLDGTDVRQMGLANYSPVAPTMGYPTVAKITTTGHDCGLVGTYRYLTTFVFTLNGREVESSALEVYKPQTFVATDQVQVTLAIITDAQVDALAGGAGALSCRVYRTKANGTEFYLLKEVAEADLLNFAYQFWDTTGDLSLGAVWLDNLNDHGLPPVATVGVIAQQRLFTNDIANPRNLCFSLNLNRFDYFPNTNAIPVDDAITALAVMRDNVVVFTGSGIFQYLPVDEISGRLEKSQSPVGTTNPDSVCATERGILFARYDGLWLFDGVTSQKVSTPIDPSWSSGTWRGAYSNQRGYYTNGTIATSFRMTDSGVEWSMATPVDYISVSPDPEDTGIYGFKADGTVKKLDSATTYKTMTVTTQEFGDGSTRQVYRILADIDSPDTTVMTVTSNRGTTQTYIFTTVGRMWVRKMVAATMIGEQFSVNFVMPQGALYRLRVETV